jgi:superfamily II DNA or RNA helicase
MSKIKKTINKYGGAKIEDCIKKKKLWNPETKRCVNDTKINRNKGAITPKILSPETNPVNINRVEKVKTPVELDISLKIYNKGDTIKWKEKNSGKELTGEIRNKTKINYIVCCKKDNSTWRVPINWDSITLVEKIKEDTINLDKDDKKLILENEKRSKYYYPKYTNDEFNTDISNRGEFNIDIPINNKNCNKETFLLSPYQIFLKNYISETTPYNSILIFHGTGVGKTCSGVSIAENFRDQTRDKNKRIIILASENIIDGWMKNIYDIDKDEDQCTGNTFKNEINEFKTGFNQIRDLKKDRKKMLKRYYEFLGYQKFISKIKKLTTNENINEEEAIKREFSDRILIIDEAHNIRNIGKPKKNKEDDSDIEDEIDIGDDNIEENIIEEAENDKDIINLLEKVVKYSDRMKLILLTATPMYNESKEISKLINLMLINDKREGKNNEYLLNEKELFDDNGFIIKGKEKIISEKLKGYVSYIRGESPGKFPVRLYPLEPNTSGYTDPKIVYKKNVKELSFLKLFTCKMINNQLEQYNSIKIKENYKLNEESELMQISNIVYPINKSDIKENYGNRGLKNYFDFKNNKYKYKKQFEDNPIFKIENLHDYSTKLYNLLETIKNSDGIIFIYSQYIKSGIIPLMIALEENGYDSFSGNNILISKTNSKIKKGKYISITGNKDISKNNSEEIKRLLQDDNKNGEKIKIIIGSRVASEGLDLKRIREIHVLDPWYHLNRLEQIIGRGIRNCSHSDMEEYEKDGKIILPEEQKNVTIYLYASIKNIESLNNLSLNDETIDVTIYKKAAEKSKAIGDIELLLKKNAVDNILFRKINIINKGEIDNIPKLVNSQGIEIKEYEQYDKINTKICSYQSLKEGATEQTDECNYLKEISVKVDNNLNTLNNNSIKNIFPLIIDFIKTLFNKKNIYTLKEIIDEFNNNKYLLDNKIIYIGLYYIIKNKIEIISKDNIKGIILYNNNNYIFEPKCLENTNKSYYYKSLSNPCPKIERFKKLTLKSKKLPTVKKINKIENTNLPEYFYYDEASNNYLLINAAKKNSIIRELKQNVYNSWNLGNVSAFTKKTNDEKKKEIYYTELQIFQNQKVFDTKLRLSNTLPPRMTNSCQGGPQIVNKWKAEYLEKNKTTKKINKSDILIFLIGMIYKMDEENFNILTELKHNNLCDILELMLRKKQNEQDKLKYYISSEQIILPFNNKTSGLIQETINTEISDINPEKIINDIIENLLNRTERKKSKKFKEIIDINSNTDYLSWINDSIELYEYALERLTFLEKYKLINSILLKYDNLTEKENIVKEYFKNQFIYEINGESKLYSNINDDSNLIINNKPDGFYLFNNK